MAQERSLKDVELKADANGVKQHIYVRVTNVLNDAEFNDADEATDPNSLVNGVQFAICDKTDVSAPENKFYLNSYDLSIDKSALLPLVNNDVAMLELLPDDMVNALANVALSNIMLDVINVMSILPLV